MSESMSQGAINLGTHVLGPFLITHDIPGLKDEAGAFLFTPRPGNVVIDAWMEIEQSLVTEELGQGPTLQFGTWADAGDRLFLALFDAQGPPAGGTDLRLTVGTPAHRALGTRGSPGAEQGRAPARFLTDAAVRVRVSDDSDEDADVGYDPITETLSQGRVRVWFLIASSGLRGI